jgi:hypothetical protein
MNNFPDASPRFVFVLGTGRCGSTLVQDVLAQHRSSGFVSNLDDNFPIPPSLGRWAADIYRAVPPGLMQKSPVRCIPSEAYNALNRDVSPILSRPFRDLRDEDVTPWLERRLGAFFDSRAEAHGTPVFLHKFTGWPRARFLRRIFPEARFIHVVRDGRAVANSWLQMSWWLGYQGPDHWQWGPIPDRYRTEWTESMQSFPALAGILWKMLIDAFIEARSQIPPGQWLNVRYEDVVERPRQCFAEMLEFAGLPFDAAFDRAMSRYTFSRGRSDAFRRDLDPETLSRLNASLREHLEQLHYTI